jgi:hypothetical protein
MEETAMNEDQTTTDTAGEIRRAILDRLGMAGSSPIHFAVQATASGVLRAAEEVVSEMLAERDAEIERLRGLYSASVQVLAAHVDAVRAGQLRCGHPEHTTAARPAGETTASRVRAVIDQYAAEDPGDGDYGDVTRDQITPEAIDALRAVAGLSDEVDRRIVAALRKAQRPDAEARQTPAVIRLTGDAWEHVAAFLIGAGAKANPDQWEEISKRLVSWLQWRYSGSAGDWQDPYDSEVNGPDECGRCGMLPVPTCNACHPSPSDLPVSPNLGDRAPDPCVPCTEARGCLRPGDPECITVVPSFGGSVKVTPAPKEPQTSEGALTPIEEFERDCPELANACVSFWACPDPDHFDHGIVEWRGNVAHCMEDGCGRTSVDTRPAPAEEPGETPRVWRAAGTGALYREGKTGIEAKSKGYTWGSTVWASLAEVEQVLGPMTKEPEETR